MKISSDYSVDWNLCICSFLSGEKIISGAQCTHLPEFLAERTCRHVAFICQDNINNIYWSFQVLLPCHLDFTSSILLLTTASLLREGHISSTRVPLKAFTCIWLRFFWVILILIMLDYSETVISLYLSEKKYSLLLDVSLYVCISILLIF